VADLGVGLIFIDGEDPDDEQLYSLAHECAHFLLHYLSPRALAIEELGDGIVPVLDRQRLPTEAERFSAALGAIRLEPFRHAIARSSGGRPTHFRTYGIEEDADTLAVELIVPFEKLRRSRDIAAVGLAKTYGLPRRIADELAADLKSFDDCEGVVSLFKKSHK
jgi:Zn-dependent peptidase ImmA (M78 family)